MKWWKVGIMVMTFMLFLNQVNAQYTVSSIVFTVYFDGYVKVTYELIPDEYTSQIVLPLIGKHFEDVMVEDGNGNPLDYQLSGGVVVIYVNNVDMVNVSYYTPNLTSKRGIVWTLNVSSTEPFTVVLPQGAVVVDLSDIPMKIAGNMITMPPRNQSVSYTLQGELAIPQTGKKKSSTSLIYGTLPLGVVLLAVLGYVFISRRKGKPTREEFEGMLSNLELNDEERKALLYLYDRGGRASQAEVREAIGIPKTTAWRMFQRLEKKGLVKILKGKKENWVELRL